MKILVVSNQFPSKVFPYKGTFIYNQVNYMNKFVDKLVVLSPNYAREKHVHEYQGITNSVFYSFSPSTNDPLLRYLFKGIFGKLRLLAFVLSQITSIIRIVLAENINIIHAHWAFPSGFSALIAKILTRRKMIITSHGSDLSLCENNAIYNFLITFILSQTDYFISISNEMNDFVKRSFSKVKNTEMLYLGIPKFVRNYIKPHQSIPNNKKKHIIFVGSLYFIKGINFLQKIIQNTLQHRNDIIFDIVSSGELMENMQEFVINNNLYNSVKLHGFLTHRDTINLISQSYLAIQTSLTEGLSVFVQESIFLGLPIVATNVGGTREIVKHNFNGFLVEYGDIDGFTKNLYTLLDNKDIYTKFSNNSLLIANDYLNSEKSNQKLLQIYKKMIQDYYYEHNHHSSQI